MRCHLIIGNERYAYSRYREMSLDALFASSSRQSSSLYSSSNHRRHVLLVTRLPLLQIGFLAPTAYEKVPIHFLSASICKSTTRTVPNKASGSRDTTAPRYASNTASSSFRMSGGMSSLCRLGAQVLIG
jgi:hypothetical protein